MMDIGGKPPAGREIRDLLRVERLDRDLFRGPAVEEAAGRVFGGQVIAQALAAATATIDPDRPAHSLHAYFMRPGDNAAPIIYRVARDHDGGSFSNRRVVAIQNGEAILNLAASFQRIDDGLEHGAAMPRVETPEDSVPLVEAYAAAGVDISSEIAARIACFDMRMGRPRTDAEDGISRQSAWFRLPGSLDAGEGMARAALGYFSDFGLISTAILPHGIAWGSKGLIVASLDHAVWFHRTPPMDQWLLYAMDSPWSGNGRGLARGMVFDRESRLVASMAQEGLMRLRKPKP
jgi:acyl-CoA thioesterase II